MAEKMKKLEEVIPVEKAVACPECGGFTFFDWGLKVLDTAYEGVGDRFKRMADQNNVLICSSCHTPIVNKSGDYFDASSFVSKETIDQVLKEGQARTHRTPVPAMDP